MIEKERVLFFFFGGEREWRREEWVEEFFGGEFFGGVGVKLFFF